MKIIIPCAELQYSARRQNTDLSEIYGGACLVVEVQASRSACINNDKDGIGRDGISEKV